MIINCRLLALPTWGKYPRTFGLYPARNKSNRSLRAPPSLAPLSDRDAYFMADQTNPFAAFAGLTQSYLEDTLGVLYIGYVFAAVGFGFTFFQSYLYYTQYPNDSWLVQSTVVCLCALDTAMSALSSHALYYYLVTLFALPVGPENATTSFCIEVLLSGFAIAIVQGSYAVRIWQASQNGPLPASIIVLAIAGAGVGIATSTVMLRNTLFTNFSEPYMKAVIAAGQGIRLLGAVLVSLGLVVFGVKSGNSGSASRWDPITDFLTSGLAAVVVQAVCFITFITMPNKYVWIIFHLLSSRVFINGLLLMLNSRFASRGRGINEEETRYNISRGVTPALQSHIKSGASDLMFNTSRPNQNHTVAIEVSRVVNSDMTKYRDDFDSHSINHKVDGL
ncbi:hypothetical protein MSAN_00699200 [Mycena sanguinolenta]|uniref:Uncharacterized protein n=1 Tax=Mycena sanguinolenta TaxID=230812 RepID=A0A8H7DF22_9AGAR|nr:hypothetical protein MSAN_00699200 [Mycena sanguinolenta]